MTKQINKADREMIDAAIAEGKTTKVKAGRARGVNKRTAPMTTTKPTRAQRKASKPKATKAARTTSAPSTARPANTFTTVDLADKQGISAKTLRARIRRNIDDWQPLFKDGIKHVFPDNKTTWGKVEALLA